MLITDKTSRPTGCCETPNNDDQRLLENAQSILAQSSYPQLREVRCECLEGVITLQGRVPSYYLKQVAQQLIRPLPQLARIHNRLEVAGGMPNSGHK